MQDVDVLKFLILAPVLLVSILLICYDIFIPKTNYKILKDKIFLKLGVFLAPFAVFLKLDIFPLLIPPLTAFHVLKTWLNNDKLEIVDLACFVMLLIIPIVLFRFDIFPLLIPLLTAFHVLKTWLNNDKLEIVDLACFIFLTLINLYAIQNNQTTVPPELGLYQQMFLGLLITALCCILLIFFSLNYVLFKIRTKNKNQ